MFICKRKEKVDRKLGRFSRTVHQLRREISGIKVLESGKTLYQRLISDSSKMKKFPDDNVKFNENFIKFLERLENTVGKGKFARYEKFLLFPQCFQKTCTADT